MKTIINPRKRHFSCTNVIFSIFNIDFYHEIINENFNLENLIEATSEANPNSLTSEHVKFFLENRFTRISLGVQSLNDSELKILGRLHDSKKALEAMELVKNSGLLLNCDLIFAIPKQT